MTTEFFPDKTVISDWFYNTDTPNADSYKDKYLITDYGILSDGKVYTEKFQSLIDMIASLGGGLIVVPKGEYITGALFFKQNVHLYIEKGGILKGSDDISDYPVMDTRIEGESCKYYPALINADSTDGICLFGEGIIDGNGEKSWKAFWQRLEWNPKATNKDEQRPRLVFISNSKNVTVSGLRLQNSHFWTNHIYKCQFVKFLGCNIFSPEQPVRAPSTDAIDIDACSDVLIKNCRFEVNDDAVALKGGKGPFADTAEENGANERVIIEDCEYGFCHSCLTCGSESIHNKNIIVRRIKVSNAINLLWLKMRPDTPQHYEYVTIENAVGSVENFININPWTQFFDLKGRKEIPLSFAEHITMQNCDITAKTFFNVKPDDEQYILSDFIFENLNIKAENTEFLVDAVKNFKVNNVNINK